MTLENLKKKYAHLNSLINGEVKTGNPIRDSLIISDAKRHLGKLLEKFPQLEEKEIKEVKKVKKVSKGE